MQKEQSRAQVEEYGEVEHELGKILLVYHVKSFCDHLVSAVKIATTYCKDIDEMHGNCDKASSVITNDRHSKVTPEELSRKWNIGLDTAKDTLQPVHYSARCLDCIPSNDKETLSRSLAPASSKTMWSMVCQHPIIQV